MAARPRNWIPLVLVCLLFGAGAMLLFDHLQSPDADRPAAPAAPDGALLRKRWRVRNTVALMAERCGSLSDDEFLRRWRALPLVRRERGRIDALAGEICPNPHEP